MKIEDELALISTFIFYSSQLLSLAYTQTVGLVPGVYSEALSTDVGKQPTMAPRRVLGRPQVASRLPCQQL